LLACLHDRREVLECIAHGGRRNITQPQPDGSCGLCANG
jgi:hypothetical protein